MKKVIALLMALTLVLSVSVLFAAAEEPESIDVHVTIVDDKSEFALAYETVTVTDIDDDGTLTINDALFSAHEQFYDNSGEAGYATQMTIWGLSLMKLWGVANGGSYGYLVNDYFAWSMTDPIQADDYIAAYVYTDTQKFSDKYAFFDDKTPESSDAGDLSVTLWIRDYDNDGNVITYPVPGAELTVDGEPTGVFTDDNGTADLSFDKGGKHLISATATDRIIVPPVCIADVTVSEATPDEATAPDAPVMESEPTEPAENDAAVAPTTATKDEATKDSSTKDSSNPKTGDATMLWLWILIAGVCLCGIVVAVVIYKKKYAKK